MDQEAPNPLEGFFQRMEKFVRDIVHEEEPASAIVLEALRAKDSGLAKRFFIEAVVDPVRQLLRDRDIAADANVFKALEELESRFRQEPVIQLLYEAEVIFGSWLTGALWAELERLFKEKDLGKLKDAAGEFTAYGGWYLQALTTEVCHALGRLAGVRERRIQLLLAAHIAGPEAVQEALGRFAGYKRDELLEEVFQQLLCSIPEKRARHIVSQLDEYGSNAQVYEMHLRFAATGGLPRSYVEKMLREVLSVKEHPRL